MGLFNRAKAQPDQGGPDLTAAGPVALPAGALTVDEETFEAIELAKTGARGQATITSVLFGGPVAGDGVLWTMGMRVQPDSGEPFDAELLVILEPEFEDMAPRQVGEIVPVVFHPDDRARVRFLPPRLANGPS